MNKKQLLFLLGALVVLGTTFLGLSILFTVSMPHLKGVCIAMCATAPDAFWGNCCTNGVLQNTVGVSLYPYAQYIIAGVLGLEILFSLVFFKRLGTRSRK